jgi:hypothetical protein
MNYLRNAAVFSTNPVYFTTARLCPTMKVMDRRRAQQGFIPLLICVFLFVIALTYLVYLRVQHAQH